MAAATAADIKLALQDALSVYTERMKAEEASPVWAGPEHEPARTWIGQRSVLALGLFEALEDVPADLLKLTLLNGKDIEI